MNVVPKSKVQSPQKITGNFLNECKISLLTKKEDLFERILSLRTEYQGRDKSGDEVDQSIEALAENQMLATIALLQEQLLDIENALARIQQGTYGVCEETEEPIEPDRLRAIPWTRLSIEGAEMREALKKRYSR